MLQMWFFPCVWPVPTEGRTVLVISIPSFFPSTGQVLSRLIKPLFSPRWKLPLTFPPLLPFRTPPLGIFLTASLSPPPPTLSQDRHGLLFFLFSPQKKRAFFLRLSALSWTISFGMEATFFPVSLRPPLLRYFPVSDTFSCFFPGYAKRGLPFSQGMEQSSFFFSVLGVSPSPEQRDGSFFSSFCISHSIGFPFFHQQNRFRPPSSPGGWPSFPFCLCPQVNNPAALFSFLSHIYKCFSPKGLPLFSGAPSTVLSAGIIEHSFFRSPFSNPPQVDMPVWLSSSHLFLPSVTLLIGEPDAPLRPPFQLFYHISARRLPSFS